jgi:PLD-like domain
MTARVAGWTMGTVGAVVGGVEVYMGPVVLGAPDDLDAVIRDFLGGAKHSLAIAVQEVDSRSIADAILAAHARGVRVQVILEGDYLMEAHRSVDPWTVRPSMGSVGDAFDSALMECVIGLFKTECIRTNVFHEGPHRTVADVEYATAAGSTGTTSAACTVASATSPRPSTKPPTTRPSRKSRNPCKSGTEPGALQLVQQRPAPRVHRRPDPTPSGTDALRCRKPAPPDRVRTPNRVFGNPQTAQ